MEVMLLLCIYHSVLEYFLVLIETIYVKMALFFSVKKMKSYDHGNFVVPHFEEV